MSRLQPFRSSWPRCPAVSTPVEQRETKKAGGGWGIRERERETERRRGRKERHCNNLTDVGTELHQNPTLKETPQHSCKMPFPPIKIITTGLVPNKTTPTYRGPFKPSWQSVPPSSSASPKKKSRNAPTANSLGSFSGAPSNPCVGVSAQNEAAVPGGQQDRDLCCRVGAFYRDLQRLLQGVCGHVHPVVVS